MVAIHHEELHTLTLTWMDNYSYFLNSEIQKRNMTDYVYQNFVILICGAVIWLCDLFLSSRVQDGEIFPS